MDLKPSFSHQSEERFSKSIGRGLKCDQSSSEPTWLSQCILWNPCIKDESNQLVGSSKGLSWRYIAEGPGKSIECWIRFMSLPLHDQANILHGVRGGWTTRLEIINGLMIRDATTQRTTMEKWIGHEEEGYLIPKCRGTPDRIEGSELRDTETPTQNNAIRVLAYKSGHKWIVDPDPIKVQPDWHICTHENTWLSKVS